VEKKNKKERGKYPLSISLILFFFVVTLVTISYFYFQRSKEEFDRSTFSQLKSIADLKVKQMVEWRRERLSDGDFLFSDSIINELVRSFLKTGSAGMGKIILAIFKGFMERQSYSCCFLIDVKGNILLAYPVTNLIEFSISNILKKDMDGAYLTDIHKVTNAITGEDDIHIDLVIPIEDKSKSTVGFIVMRIDPRTYLYPLIQSWPIESRTGETLLVRKEGDFVLFINELRHKKGSAMKLKLPLTRKNLPAVMAVLGYEGLLKGIDYRNIPVLSYVRSVPNTAWYIVAKIDENEVYENFYRASILTGIIVVILIVFSVFIIFFIWNRREVEHLAFELKLEKEKLAMLDRVSYLTRYANDIILLMDDKLNIIEANEKAERVYGYSIEELKRKNLKDLRITEFKGELEDEYFGDSFKDGKIIEAIHQRKDGSSFPVESSIVQAEIGGEKYYQAIIRDITERKGAEKKLRKLNRTLQILSSINQAIVRIRDQEQLLKEVCRIAIEKGGFKMAWIGLLEEDTKRVKVVASAGFTGDYLEKINITVEDKPEGRGPTGRAIREGRTAVCSNIENDPAMIPWRENAMRMGYRSSAAFPLVISGRSKGAFNLYSEEEDFFGEEEVKNLEELALDISFAIEFLEIDKERKNAEEEIRKALKEKETLLKEVHHRVKNNMQIISSMLGLQEKFVKDTRAIEILGDIKSRIKTMALTHEMLYGQPKISEIDIREIVDTIVQEIRVNSNLIGKKIDITTEVEDIRLNVSSAMPCAQIVNELLMNAVKYAFPDKEEGKIFLSVKREENGTIDLVIQDNGVGFPEGFVFPGENSIGLTLVQTFVNQLDGELIYFSDNGVKYQIRFKADR